MLEVSINPKKEEQITTKENIRAVLRNLTVNIKYEDIYQNLNVTYLSSVQKNQQVDKNLFKLPTQN